jgi:hypothetical protein
MARAQTCQMVGDMGPATSSALTATAKRFYDMAARGDSASLRQNAIPGLASNFSGIESAVKDNQPNLSGVQPVPRPAFYSKPRGRWRCNVPSSCAVFSAPRDRLETAQSS